jgi:hypothetical protein
MSDFWVNGIVSSRNGQPYIQLATEKGMLCQMSMAEARNVAMDILQMCARTESDAMIVKFFGKMEFPDEALGGLLIEFRDFRAELDQEKINTSMVDPDTGDKV